MKASELRIGNKVDLYGSTATIQGQDFVNHYTTDDRNFDRFKPILLTEEWLLKLGFKVEYCDDGTPYYTKDLSESKYCSLSIMSSDENGFMEITLFPYGQWFRYRYVHQLQNLYFALTGKELEVKELIK